MNFNEMLNAYKALTAADAYIIGFIHNASLYCVLIDELPLEMLSQTHMSSKRGGYAKIRIRLNSALRMKLMRKAIKLGSTTMLDTNDKYNNGDRFERIIVETLTNQTWEKNSIPFYEDGDVTLAGHKIQIKFDGAELTNERILKRRLAL